MEVSPTAHRSPLPRVRLLLSRPLVALGQLLGGADAQVLVAVRQVAQGLAEQGDLPLRRVGTSTVVLRRPGPVARHRHPRRRLPPPRTLSLRHGDGDGSPLCEPASHHPLPIPLSSSNSATSSGATWRTRWATSSS